jgi:hypothetical protein
MLEMAASYGPKMTLVLCEPVGKRGTARNRASGRTLQLQGGDMGKRGEKRERRSAILEPDAAGIDIGAEEIYVAVPPDRDEQATRRFSSFT